MIPGALLAGPALHGLVLVDRPEPDGRGAQSLDVVEPRGEALQIAAVVETLVRRIEAGGQAVACEPAAVVGRVAVLEAVGQHEVDDFVFGQNARGSRTPRDEAGAHAHRRETRQ